MTGIAICYRREDTGWIAGRIFDRLKAHYQKAEIASSSAVPKIFMDYDSIPLGVDFRDYLKGVLDRSEVVLALIGPRWADAEDGVRNRRLNMENDWVRVEVETALKRKIPLIPVLIDRTPLPNPASLPESIRDLTFRHCATVDTQVDFEVHMERLIREIDRLLQSGSGFPAHPSIEPGDSSQEGGNTSSSSKSSIWSYFRAIWSKAALASPLDALRVADQKPPQTVDQKTPQTVDQKVPRSSEDEDGNWKAHLISVGDGFLLQLRRDDEYHRLQLESRDLELDGKRLKGWKYGESFEFMVKRHANRFQIKIRKTFWTDRIRSLYVWVDNKSILHFEQP